MTRGTTFHKPAVLHGYSMMVYCMHEGICIQIYSGKGEATEEKHYTCTCISRSWKLVTMVTDRCESSL